jgi:hypothetical protein
VVNRDWPRYKVIGENREFTYSEPRRNRIDVDLTNVSIKESNLTGVKINGVLVSELIRIYEKHSK